MGQHYAALLSKLDALAKELAVVGHVTRLRIALLLRDGELSPKQAHQRLDGLSLGTVSHHFRKLAADGLVVQTRTRPARGAVEHFYALSPEGKELLDRLDVLNDA